MKMGYRLSFPLLAAATFVAAGSTTVSAEDYKTIRPSVEARGHIRNEALRKKGKDFYASEEGFAELWKAWPKGKPPKVDFSKELVLTATCGGPNRPSVGVSLMKDGNLRWGAACTKRGGPGFGYWIGIVPRDGVKKVNGKDLPPPAKKAEAK